MGGRLTMTSDLVRDLLHSFAQVTLGVWVDSESQRILAVVSWTTNRIKVGTLTSGRSPKNTACSSCDFSLLVSVSPDDLTQSARRRWSR